MVKRSLAAALVLMVTPWDFHAADGDRIVPPASAAALADALGGAERWELAAGHVGMVAGGIVTGALYEPLSGWLEKALR